MTEKFERIVDISLQVMKMLIASVPPEQRAETLKATWNWNNADNKWGECPFEIVDGELVYKDKNTNTRSQTNDENKT